MKLTKDTLIEGKIVKKGTKIQIVESNSFDDDFDAFFNSQSYNNEEVYDEYILFCGYEGFYLFESYDLKNPIARFKRIHQKYKGDMGHNPMVYQEIWDFLKKESDNFVLKVGESYYHSQNNKDKFSLANHLTNCSQSQENKSWMR